MTQASMEADPASACAAASTLESVKGVVLAVNDLPEGDRISESYRDQIISGAELKLAKPAVAQFDKQATIVTCSANVTFTWPKNLAARLAAISPDVDWTSQTSGLMFSLRPKSEGPGLDVAMLSGSGEVTGTVQSMVSALYQSDQRDMKAAEDARMKSMDSALRAAQPTRPVTQRPSASSPDEAAAIAAAAARRAAERAARYPALRP